MTTTNKTANQKTVAVKCYACDAAAIGTRDRRPEGGKLEPACKRHAEAVGSTCRYCLKPIDLYDGYDWKDAHRECADDARHDREGRAWRRDVRLARRGDF